MNNSLTKIRSGINRFGYFGFLRTLGYLAKYRIYILLGRKYLKRRIHNYLLELDLTDEGISRQLVVNGTREEQLHYLLKKELGKGSCVLDIGANIGYYPIMEAKIVGEQGLIYAVEPAHDNFERLLRNIKLNELESRFKTFNIGISNKNSIERFYISTHSNLHTFIKEGYAGQYITKGTSEKFVECPVMELTSFLSDKRKVDLIRMDVEGYEVEILAGLEEAIKTDIFTGDILFECHFPKYHKEKHSIDIQLNMLKKYGYSVKYITSNNEEKSTIKEYGYKQTIKIVTGDFIEQAVYEYIKWDDAIKLISEIGGVRDVFLTRNHPI